MASDSLRAKRSDKHNNLDHALIGRLTHDNCFSFDYREKGQGTVDEARSRDFRAELCAPLSIYAVRLARSF